MIRRTPLALSILLAMGLTGTAQAFDLTTATLVVSGYATSQVTSAPFDRKWVRAARDDAAADALTRSAELSERAWQLGEGSLAETLNARRLAHEARLAARLARLDASESRYRLLLDAHQLWPLDMDDGADGDHDHP